MSVEDSVQDDIQKVEASTGNPRGGLELCFNLPPDRRQTSDVWSIAGWRIRFLALPPDGEMTLPSAESYIKVILGSLATPRRGCFSEDFTVRSTRVMESGIRAGENGTLLAVCEKSASASMPITTMDQCRFEGPDADRLAWKRFSERFGAFTDYFNELDNHMADGFHLVDPAGREIVYVNFWTCGKRGDVSTHNHGHSPGPHSPAFVEVHLVLNNGTGQGGMYETDGPESVKRMRHIMQAGEEHGPFFHHRDGRPVRLENGAVSYPWHGWESGDDRQPGQAYDLVAAFEINPELATL
ncbi:MAG: hypothetical protein O3B72_04980 [Proteobacteria bacterium]|nr:hypothetical protein [Pseudomonadota bacterium]